MQINEDKGEKLRYHDYILQSLRNDNESVVAMDSSCLGTCFKNEM